MPDNDTRAFSAPGHIILKVYALVIAVTKDCVILPCADQANWQVCEFIH